MDFDCLIGVVNNKTGEIDEEEGIFGLAPLESTEDKTSKISSSVPLTRGRAKTYPCPECTGTFRKKKDYIIHYTKVHHTRTIPFKCDECPKAFSKSAHLKTHMTRAHPKLTEDMSFKCSKCPAAFDENDSLDRHYIKVHRVGQRKTFQCPHCPKTFVKKGHYQMHLPSHSADRPYSCSICTDSYFKSKASLVRHWKKNSHNMKSEDCPPDIDVSNSATKSNSAIYEHNILSEDIVSTTDTFQPPIYQCEKCPNIYHTQGNLDRHLDSEHSKASIQAGEKTGYDCPKCNTFFAKQSSFKHHLAYYHNETEGFKNRLFLCSQCNLKFCTKKTFQMHMFEIHQVIKYMKQCEVCSKPFATNYRKRLHMKRVHADANAVSVSDVVQKVGFPPVSTQFNPASFSRNRIIVNPCNTPAC